MTFETAASEYIKAHKPGWSNARHAAQWANALDTYASPTIGKKAAATSNTEDVLQLLRPIWSEKTETASRVRSRVELVRSYARAMKWREGENPARRGHLDALLPKPGKVRAVMHHPALPFARVPSFMAKLATVEGSGARALEFAILTAARSGEVRLLTSRELDLDGAVWTVPAARMKAKRDHRVPLSAAAAHVLERSPTVDENPSTFAGTRKKSPVSDVTLAAAIGRLNEATTPAPWVDPKTGNEVVPHGFRSCA